MQERLKAALATAGWTPAEASDWTDDVPMPIEPGQEASTIARIEGR